MDTNIFDVLIIGSGPAGYTAAIYCARANLSVGIFKGQQPGGQLTITTEVENFPGFPNSISGTKLMTLMEQQSQRFNTVMFSETISKLEVGRPFVLTTETDNTYKAKAIILATGATAKLLGIPSEETYFGYGISACATCDGFFYKNKRVFVVGGGDTAMEDATYLSQIASSVVLVHRRQEFRASNIMINRVKNNPKIELLLDSVIEEFVGCKINNIPSLTGVRIKNTKINEIKDYETDGVFLAIGHHPNTKLVEGIVNVDKNGYIITAGKTSHTNIDGIFACGDVQDPLYRQAITAAGSGCIAAQDSERWLTENY